jgi:hypothetical protein
LVNKRINEFTNIDTISLNGISYEAVIGVIVRRRRIINSELRKPGRYISRYSIFIIEMDT